MLRQPWPSIRSLPCAGEVPDFEGAAVLLACLVRRLTTDEIVAELDRTAGSSLDINHPPF